MILSHLVQRFLSLNLNDSGPSIPEAPELFSFPFSNIYMHIYIYPTPSSHLTMKTIIIMIIKALKKKKRYNCPIFFMIIWWEFQPVSGQTEVKKLILFALTYWLTN